MDVLSDGRGFSVTEDRKLRGRGQRIVGGTGYTGYKCLEIEDSGRTKDLDGWRIRIKQKKTKKRKNKDIKILYT